MNLLERHPDSPEWRADALARSGHSRLTDGLPEPRPPGQRGRATVESGDPCGEICRELLGDFAPALLLLNAGSRRRVQALAAFARVLEDCAREHGTEGQRLAALNRWEFALEEALDGAPAEHPAFAAMARADRLRPWPRTALAALVAGARRRSTHPEGDRRAAAALAAGLAEALFGEPPPPRLVALAAAILNSPRPQPERDHGPAGTSQRRDDPTGSAGTPRRQGLADDGAIQDAPPAWRAALRYALLAARAHVASAGDAGRARSLPASTRLVLLACARWGARARWGFRALWDSR